LARAAGLGEQLADELSELFGRRVDPVSLRAVRPLLQRSVLAAPGRSMPRDILPLTEMTDAAATGQSLDACPAFTVVRIGP